MDPLSQGLLIALSVIAMLMLLLAIPIWFAIQAGRVREAQRNRGLKVHPKTGTPTGTVAASATATVPPEPATPAEEKKKTDKLVKRLLSHYLFWAVVFLVLVTIGIAVLSEAAWIAILTHPVKWLIGIFLMTMGVVFRIEGNKEVQNSKLPFGKGVEFCQWTLFILGLLLWGKALADIPIDGKIPMISMPKGTFGPGMKYYPEGQAPTTLGLATLGDGEGIKVVVHPGQASERVLIPEGMDWADEVIAGSPDINRILASGTREEFCCVIKKDGLEKIIQDPLSLRALDRAGFLERELKGPKTKPVMLTYSLPQSARNSVTIHIIRRSQ